MAKKVALIDMFPNMLGGEDEEGHHPSFEEAFDMLAEENKRLTAEVERLTKRWHESCDQVVD